ncbi:MAG: hypothetical protein PVI90_00880 [Desulfobacteraceae bacterium]|jgi:hypothetical protein
MKRTDMINNILDALHTTSSEVAAITKRRRRIRRQHVIAFINIASTFVGALVTTFPQAGIIAKILNILQGIDYIPKATQESIAAPMAQVLVKLQAVDTLLSTATGEQRVRLEAQRDVLIKLVSDLNINNAK